MAFTVEDETGLANANAYISVAEYKAYLGDRGKDITGTDEELEDAIVKATDYMEQRWGPRFKGNKEFKDVQFLSFPRIFLWDREGVLVVGLPVKLKNACAEYALIAKAAALFLTITPETSGQLLTLDKSVVGPIEIEKRFSSSGGQSNTVVYPEADRWITEYLKSVGNAIRG